MDIARYLDAIAREAGLLARAAAAAGPDAQVPTCPEWCVRDLVRHQGEVHRWAAAVVEGRSPDNIDAQDVVGPWPEDTDLVEWFEDGSRRLLDVLGTAPPDLECFTFLPAPSPLLFWARRQTHETGIHRVDAQRAAGDVTPFPIDQAVDGIEEILYGFAGRPTSRLRSEQVRTLALRATDAGDPSDAVGAADAGRAWHVTIEADRASVVPGGGPADCSVEAPASTLFQFLWNRLDAREVTVQGDGEVIELWRRTMRIRWS